MALLEFVGTLVDIAPALVESGVAFLEFVEALIQIRAPLLKTLLLLGKLGSATGGLRLRPIPELQGLVPRPKLNLSLTSSGLFEDPVTFGLPAFKLPAGPSMPKKIACCQPEG